MSGNKQGSPAQGILFLAVIFIIFLLIWSIADFGVAFLLLIAFFLFIISANVFIDDSPAWKVPTDNNSKKSDFDYRINSNKDKHCYSAETKSHPKERVIKPTPPFHPSTHVIVKDGKPVDSRPASQPDSPKQNDLYDYWKSRSNQTPSSQASLSTPRERLKTMRDDIVKSKKKSPQPKTPVSKNDARTRLKKMRDDISKSKKNTVDDTCSISPEITKDNIYWNYTPNTVELTSKQKGDMFEEYVIHKFDPKYFLLVEMRSDKGSNGIYPESNQYPDQVWRHKPDSFEFAVECKWRSGWWLRDDKKHWIDLMGGGHKLAVYNRFAQQKNMSVSIALGVGGQPDSPIELYIIPLSVLQYRYAEYTYLQHFRHHDVSQNFYLDTYSRTLR